MDECLRAQENLKNAVGFTELQSLALRSVVCKKSNIAVRDFNDSRVLEDSLV